MVVKKPYSWLKHAVRRWKELYYEIQRTDGNLDSSSPLSFFFRNEGFVTKLEALANNVETNSSESTSSKKDETVQPAVKSHKDPVVKSKEKRNKDRFSIRFKEVQLLQNPFSLF
ncbi:MAG: hypothetical protein ACFFD8_10970 [Candidatus Thorarchaeota archaeon]